MGGNVSQHPSSFDVGGTFLEDGDFDDDVPSFLAEEGPKKTVVRNPMNFVSQPVPNLQAPAAVVPNLQAPPGGAHYGNGNVGNGHTEMSRFDDDLL